MDNIQKVTLNGEISNPDGFGKIGKTSNTNAPSFSEVMTSMVKNLDATQKAPDQVLQNAITGNGADVHDVMIAISKADIGINIATNITTKVVQAYDKVMSIQL